MASKYANHRDKWKTCDKCSLCETRKRVVLYRGTIPAKVLVVGEAPGKSEDVIGKPFSGPAGHLLNEILRDSLESLEITYLVTNLIGCIPLEQSPEGKLSKVTAPPKFAVEACSDRLREIQEIVSPKGIVFVGKEAEKQGKKIFNLERVASIGITHPSALLRSNLSQSMLNLYVQKIVVGLLDFGEKLNARPKTA